MINQNGPDKYLLSQDFMIIRNIWRFEHLGLPGPAVEMDRPGNDGPNPVPNPVLTVELFPNRGIVAESMISIPFSTGVKTDKTGSNISMNAWGT